MNKTHNPNLKYENQWYMIDAKGKTLGRLSTRVVNILRGKNNPNYNPSQNCKNHIIIINTKKIEITGQKKYNKLYYRHSGKPGGMKTETFEELQKRLPNRIIENSIRKMLPKGSLGRTIFKNLKVYAGDNHPHQSQNPITIEI